jgi:hypothetical protein
MAANPDHPTFKWPRPAAVRLAAASASVARLHSIKLRAYAVACHHTGPWASPLPRLLPLLPRDPVPLSGPMLGCSAVYSPTGEALAEMQPGREGLALANLPLLRQPHVVQRGAAGGAAELVDGELVAAAGAAAAAAAACGPAAPYARFPGGYVIEPAGWQVRWGFPLMEMLGSFYYHCWLGPLRRQVARTIVAEGVWLGPVPALESGPAGCRGAALAAAVVLATAGVVAWARRA